MSKKSYIFFSVVCLILMSSAVYGQDGDQNAPFLNYTDDVLRYSLEYPSYDPISLVMPAVSQPAGFGTFQENPAAMALFDKSYFSFDLSSRFVNETGRYLDNESDFSDNQTSIGDLGLIYKIPTTRGSLVIGGGYSQTTDFNRAVSASARNNLTTITDTYANRSMNDPINTAAFNAFAIDTVTLNNGATESRSIFRFPVDENYPGINQNFELTERGSIGEYSAFISTEFFKNLMIGVSIGVINGRYSLNRDFVEIDDQGDYEGDFINTDEGQTDIDNIVSEEVIEATITGFSARIGLVYQLNKKVNLGASYQFKNPLQIDEKADFYVTTTMDNGVNFNGDDLSEYKYQMNRADRLNFGITARDLSGLTISASAEYLNYTRSSIEFDEMVIGTTDINQLENRANDLINTNFRDVYNVRSGLEYTINKRFTPRIGYAYYPSPQEGADTNRDRQFISGGFSAVLTPGLIFDFGLQYSFWDDQNTLYQTPAASEVVQEEVSRISMMVGLRMTL